MKTTAILSLVSLTVLVNILSCTGQIIENQGGLFFRLSSEGLTKVVKAMAKSNDGSTLYYDVIPSRTNGTEGNEEYHFSGVTKSFTNKAARPTITSVSITDDNQIKVNITLPKEVTLTGNLKLIHAGRRREVYNKEFDLTYEDATIVYTGGQDEGTTITENAQHVVTLKFPECEPDWEGLDGEDRRRLDDFLNRAERRRIYKHLLCDQFPLIVPLSLGASNIEFKTMGHVLSVQTGTASLDIKDGELYVTQTVISTEVDGSLVFKVDQGEQAMTTPSFTDKTYPFQVAFSVDSFKQIFLGFKEKLGIGLRPASLRDLVGEKDKSRYIFDTNSLEMGFVFSQIGFVFPNATAEILVLDLDFDFKMEDDKMHVIVDMSCNMIVTLNCDTKRTYSALNFTTKMDMPVQVGHDNKFLTLKILGAGAQMNILHSNIGHIADDQFDFIMEQAVSGIKWYEINDKIEGVPIRDLIPPGLYEDIKDISIVKDYIIVSMEFLDKNPQLKQLNRSSIAWVGKTMTAADTFTKIDDRTPVNLKTMKVQDCNPATPESEKSTSSLADTIHHGNVIVLFLFSLILVFRAI